MRVSLEWLKEYVDIAGLSAQEIAAALTNSGLEVEHIETAGPRFTNVVVGRVLAIEPHPNADKLRLVQVDLGDTEVKVVCGAPNVRVDIFIAFAREGAQVISRKDGTLFTLGKAKIRGVESAGMVCSLEELGLETQYNNPEDGIWPLDALVNEAHLGQDLKSVLGLAGDTILEVAPTANRGDLMSMLGVAREVAALFDRPFYRPEYQHFPERERTEIRVGLHDSQVCWYYGGLMMRNIKIGPSPEWMVRRLEAAGMRSISNVVDITNYVMLEMGQPLHAFDWDKLGHAGEIDVRRAHEGESMTTLDTVQRKLTSDSVVVTMHGRPVALAGVMGGLDTEIDDHSRNLFLEGAYFPPATTRRSAKSVGLRTEASARFERGVDAESCRNALLRAAELLQQYAGGQFIRMVESPMPSTEAPYITLRFERLKQVLGVDIEPETVERILKKLGFFLQPGQAHANVVVQIPSFRQGDVYREIDLIEEVARIYGYEKIPYTLPRKTASVGVSLRARMISQVHTALQAQGLQEVVTTSLVGDSLLEKTGFSLNQDQLVSVLNSHSADHTLMRQSLLPNLLEVAKFNQAQGTEDVWIYELGRTYFKLGKANLKNAGVSERLHLAGLITGNQASGGWQRQESTDFYLLKGVLEALLSGFNLKDIVFKPVADVSHLHPGRSASVCLGENAKEIGMLGELHPQLRHRLKFRQPVYAFELNMEALYKLLKQHAGQTGLIAISPFPAIKRDMAFLAPASLSHQEVLNILRGQKEPLLREIALFDEYRSEQLGADKRSLAYRLTFQSEEATLTDADVDQPLKRLKDALSQALPIQFR